MEFPITEHLQEELNKKLYEHCGMQKPWMALDSCLSRFVPYLTSLLFSPYFARLFCILIKSRPECKEQMVSLLFQVSLSGKAATRELKDFRKLHLAYEGLFPMQRCSLQPPPFRRPCAASSQLQCLAGCCAASASPS